MVRLIKQEPELIKAIFRSDIKEVRELLDEDEDSVDYRDNEKRTPLHAASYMGDPEVVRLLLEYGARVNVKDSQWLYPLHRACASSNKPKAKDIVSILLDNDADVNARDKSLRTCLHIAAKHNSIDCVELIINQNLSSINVSDRSGRTALHIACAEGHLQMAELLIQNSAKVNVSDKKERRPIHCTAIQGSVDILELLVSAGADLNARDKDKMTALHIASATGNLEIVTTLLDMEANINTRNSFGNTPAHLAALNGHVKVLHELLGEDFDLESRNNTGHSLVHLACRSQHAGHNTQDSCLNLLIFEGASLDVVDNCGRTPLHLAAGQGGQQEIELIVKHAHHPAQQLQQVDKKGQSCVHQAAAAANSSALDTILSLYAKHDIDVKEEVKRTDFCGRSPLHLAATAGNVGILRRLVQSGATVDMGDASDRTALHAAAYSGKIECVEFLLSCGADLNLPDSDGRLCLHYSACAASISCLETLLLHGSAPDHQDRHELTALHLAARHDSSGACVQTLIAKKADHSILDKKGWNVLHYAATSGNWASIQHILQLQHTSHQVTHCSDDGEQGTTPIHLAAYLGHSEALILLLSVCRSPDLVDGAGRSALYLAASSGQLESCVLLIEQGCDPGLASPDSGRTPLHAAADKGHVEVLERLLSARIKYIDIKDSDGLTPLMLASSSGHLDCVRMLSKHKSDARVVDKKGRTALTWAILQNQETAAELIIETYGKCVLTRDKGGRTACHLAAASGQLKPLLSIVELDAAAVTWTDNTGLTALHYAAQHGEAGALEVLINFAKGGDLWSRHLSVVHSCVLADQHACLKLVINSWGKQEVDNKTRKGWSPLHTAASNNSLKCASILINSGAHINTLDNKKRTPLIMAAKNGHFEMVELLVVQQGVDTTCQDYLGNTALHYSCSRGDGKMSTFLLEHMEGARLDSERVSLSSSDNCVSTQNARGKTPLHLAAGQGMVETTKMLLLADASVTLTDEEGNPPALCCAKDDDTATCLAMILAAYLAAPVHQSRKSLCSVNSSRRSEMVLRLSEYLSDVDITRGNTPSPDPLRRSVTFDLASQDARCTGGVPESQDVVRPAAGLPDNTHQLETAGKARQSLDIPGKHVATSNKV